MALTSERKQILRQRLHASSVPNPTHTGVRKGLINRTLAENERLCARPAGQRKKPRLRLYSWGGIFQKPERHGPYSAITSPHPSPELAPAGSGRSWRREVERGPRALILTMIPVISDLPAGRSVHQNPQVAKVVRRACPPPSQPPPSAAAISTTFFVKLLRPFGGYSLFFVEY